ncbi:Carbonic anhydrase [Psilocybe cubensis]|uniref:carbonic anhydrase n=2 Tax=Psilocybe cubensis TaxID=181762 RepID=A0A8H7Y519_PSICU|nr:Carbonic anhydrase [Psilocybe cubensis]KAH9485145.1 Carbonic anhydrase [Psilocybe cubensis]
MGTRKVFSVQLGLQLSIVKYKALVRRLARIGLVLSNLTTPLKSAIRLEIPVMLTLHQFTLFMSSVFLLPLLVSSHPVLVNYQSSTPSHETVPKQVANAQITLGVFSNSTNPDLHTLQALYDGNQKFRESADFQADEAEDESPSFMFLSCSDNRWSPNSIFSTPAGSIITHTNIANQYSHRDASVNSAIAYAVESVHVQHIIVLGHYGCKGVETAITESSKISRLVRKWVRPISAMYAISRRQEIVILRDSRKPRRGQDDGIKTAPPASDPGFRALVEENVKRGVKELRTNTAITQAHARHIKTAKNEDIDVFVHGFVYDESTGEVHNLNISFGPPGKTIPSVPFKALATARNFHRDHDRPGISKGKTWDFGAH